MRLRLWGVVFLLLAVSGAVGCRQSVNLVDAIECAEGDTQSCQNPAGCGVGTQVCSADGRWLPCGKIDYSQVDHKPCYTGPAGTNWKGICRSGFEICSDGKMICAFEQTPMALNCQNGADNDCSGQVDAIETPNQNPDVDVVLFLDESGSMQFAFPIVQDAVTQFAQANSSDTNMRIALVGAPHLEDGKCGLIADFRPPRDIPAAIGALDVSHSIFGDEPTIDCPYLAARPENTLKLTYRPNARKAFISFSDEFAQTYLDPPKSATAAGALMASLGIKFYSYDASIYRNSYKPMVTQTGGASFNLHQSAEELLDSLLSLFSRISCG